ncbi:ABC transporter substrate-binding protein [Bacillus sp. 03113]|uniref:ABC transporter substrate-binding protein n=1 Tax=Bacillus sp. 03113 TaxID=2578211 RepID=UPI0011416124|nr:ABC transporter substrate-binding protein [Bacillus sp. 03113]
MRWISNWKLAAVMLIVLSILVSACSPNKQTSSKKEDPVSKELTVTVGGDPVGLDPQNVTDTISSLINYQIYDRLVTFNGEMEIIPQLAKSWTTSEDGKTWTFELNKGISFTDGTPFNAEAVKTSFERVANKDKNLKQYSLVGQYIDSITTNGETTVVFHLKAPQGAFLGNLAHPASSILSPKSIKENEEGIAKNPVGTGPFKLKEWMTGDAVVLEANSDYWSGKPSVKTVTFKNVPETSASVIMLETGEADLTGSLPLAELNRLEDNDTIMANSIEANRIAYVGFNTTVEPFNKVEVRQAINYAIDKETMVSKLYDGRVRTSTAAISESTFGYSNVGAYPFDISKAKTILKEAGVVPEDYSFRLIFAANVTQDKPAAEFVQNSLQQLGFKVELQTLELGAYLEALKDPSKYDLFMRGALANTGDADPLFRDALLSTSPTNYAHYNNPEVDKFIMAGQSQVKPSERLKSYTEVLKMVKKDAPWIFLHEDVAHWGVAKNVEGITFLPTYIYDLRKAVKK